MTISFRMNNMVKRKHWKKDEEFLKFNKQMYDEYFTFDEIFAFSTLDKVLKFNSDIDLNKIRNKWNTYIKKWNEIENINYIDKTKGFVAITYLMLVLPYKNINNIEVFTEFDINNINVIYFYNKSKYINYTGIEELFDSGPFFPPAYRDWLNDKYNRASWWVAYRIYERKNNLECMIDSKPTRKI